MIPVNDLKRGFGLFQREYEEKVLEVLRSGWYILGKECENFEKEYAEALGGECFCAGVDNGLDAIALGLQAAGIQNGDEVILQANGYIATVLGVMHCGAKPVFVEPNEYYQMDYEKIEAAITDKTKAVLVTHLYGMATRMDKIREICKQYNLMLFEDCAQSHFSSYNTIYTGMFGDASFFSFYPTKNLGGFGDGGCVVSKNEEIINKVRVLRNYGSDYRYHNIEEGYNCRLDEIQAGLLRIKLSHRDQLIKNRRHVAERYLKEINNPKVELPRIAEGCTHVWYQFIVRVGHQERFREFLKQKGIATDISWKVPPYLQPCMAKYGFKRGDYPITESICDSIVTLPMMDAMSEDEITQVIRGVNEYKEM